MRAQRPIEAFTLGTTSADERANCARRRIERDQRAFGAAVSATPDAVGVIDLRRASGDRALRRELGAPVERASHAKLTVIHQGRDRTDASQ